MTEQRPVGRPSIKTPELVDALLTRLMTGETLRSICRDADMPNRDTVFRWIRDDKDFSGQYMQAREIGLDSMFDEALEIADDGSQDTLVDEEGRERLNSEWVQRSRLRIDTRKWYLARAMPKKYGEKVEQTLVGDPDRPVHSNVTERKVTYEIVKAQPIDIAGGKDAK